MENYKKEADTDANLSYMISHRSISVIVVMIIIKIIQIKLCDKSDDKKKNNLN